MEIHIAHGFALLEWIECALDWLSERVVSGGWRRMTEGWLNEADQPWAIMGHHDQNQAPSMEYVLRSITPISAWFAPRSSPLELLQQRLDRGLLSFRLGIKSSSRASMPLCINGQAGT